MDELISVLVPSYNHENYVQETIWSIINQTYKNLELIIINDGSKDKTHEKILELENECNKRFIKFKYINKKNAGVSEALNDGIDEAKGKYVYIIASDDLAKPEAIETLYEFIKDQPEYALVVGDDEFIDPNSKRVVVNCERNIIYEPQNYYNEPIFETVAEWASYCNNFCLVDFNSEEFGTYGTIFHNCYIPNGYLINRQAIIDAGKYMKDCAEDWYMFLQLAKKYKFKYLDKILFSYRCHPTNSQKNKRYFNRIVQKVYKHEKEYCYKNGYKVDYKAKVLIHRFNKIPKRIEKIFRGLFKMIFKDYYYFYEKLSQNIQQNKAIQFDMGSKIRNIR